MAEGKCPICQKTIGGKEHKESAGQTHFQKNQVSAKRNYCCPLIKDKYEKERGLSTKNFRILRFFVNSLLYFNSISNENEVKKIIDPIVNVSGNIVQFFANQIKLDWQILLEIFEKNEEELSIIIHLVISRVLKNQRKFKNIGKLNNESSRTNWENIFVRICNENFFKTQTIDNEITKFQIKLNQRIRMNKQNDVLTLELLDQLNYVRNSANREKYLPSIFILRKLASFHDFLIKTNELDKNEFPLLHNFVNLENQVSMFYTLPSIFKFIEILYSKLNRKIYKREAYRKRIVDIVGNLTGNEKKVWVDMYTNFKKAFNSLWPHLIQTVRVNCQELKPMKIDENSFLINFLPVELHDQENLSFLIILIEWLVDIYNRMVEISETAYRFSTNQFINHNLFSEYYCINYHRRELFNFIKDHNTYENSNIVYDFKTIQYFLYEQYFANKERIKFIKPTFEYTDLHASDVKKALMQIITQVEISFRDRESIIRSLSKKFRFYVRKLLRYVSYGILFLTKPFLKQKLMGEENFFVYLKEKIFISDIDQYFPKEIRKYVKLKNIISFVDILQSLLNEDVFINIPAKYKVDYTEFGEFKTFLEKQNVEKVQSFANILKDFILKYLNEEGYGSNKKLFDYINWFEHLEFTDKFEDIKWISKTPQIVQKKLLVKHACAFYKFIQKYIMKQKL